MNQFNAPLWGDEGFSAILSMHSLPDIIRIIINDTSPPLWNIFEWIVFNTLGTGEIYIRALAFTFFLITILFVFKITAFLFDKKTAVIASALTALNPFFFTYAFEGRMYSIMSAGVAGSFYFFSRLMFDGNKVQKKHLVGYIVMTLWALYSHHFAMFAVLTQGLWFLYLLLTRNKAVKLVFLGFIGVGIGYLPWLWPLYNQTKMVGGGFWLGKPAVADLVGLILEYLAYGIKHNLAPVALAAIGLTFALRKWGHEILKSLFLVSWFLIPIFATFIISQLFTPVFFNRYLLYTIAAAMIVAASNRRRISMVAIAGALLLFSIIDFNYFTHPIKLRFDQLATFVKQTKTQDDFLINWNSAAHHLWETKYYGIPAPIYIPGGSGTLPFFVGTALMEKGDIISEIPKNAKRVGVVTSGPIEEITLPGYTESERKIIDRLKFIWYSKN